MTFHVFYMRNLLLFFMVGFQLVQMTDSFDVSRLMNFFKDLLTRIPIFSRTSMDTAHLLMYDCEFHDEFCIKENLIDYRKGTSFPKQKLDGIYVIKEQCDRDLDCVITKQCHKGCSMESLKAGNHPDKECSLDCKNIGPANVSKCLKQCRKNTTKSSGRGFIEGDTEFLPTATKQKLHGICVIKEQFDGDFDCVIAKQCEEGYSMTCITGGNYPDTEFFVDCKNIGTANVRTCLKQGRENTTISCGEESLKGEPECLPSDIRLGGQCEIDAQSNWTGISKQNKTCSNVEFFRNSLICILDKFLLVNPFELYSQCTGTKDAGVCKHDQTMEKATCKCNAGFKRSDADCLQGSIAFLFNILSGLVFLLILKIIQGSLYQYFKTGGDIEKYSEMESNMSKRLASECELWSKTKYPNKNGKKNMMKIANCIEVDEKAKSKLEIFFSKYMTDYALSWERATLTRNALFIVPILIISRMQDDLKKVNEYLDKHDHKKQRIILVAIHNCHKDNIKLRTLCKTPPNEKIHYIINIFTWKNEFYTCDANFAASKTFKNLLNSDESSL